jgi:nitroreductase
MDAGHAAQNVYLQAGALNLGIFVIGGFDDDALRRVIPLTSEKEPLSIMPAGRTNGAKRSGTLQRLIAQWPFLLKTLGEALS